jgi:hypothetical protein
MADVGVDPNVADAEGDYDLVKDLHTQAGLVDADDAAVIQRRADEPSRSQASRTRPGGSAACWRLGRHQGARLSRGEENAIAAVLRGALVCAGDVEVLFAIQRIFPGPPRDRHATSGSEGSR